MPSPLCFFSVRSVGAQHAAPLSPSTPARLPVYFTQHYIEGSYDRDQVGEHGALAHLLNGAKVHERGWPDPHTIGLGAAVADDVVAEFPLRRLDSLVDLAFGDRETFAGDFKVVDQPFDAVVD